MKTSRLTRLASGAGLLGLVAACSGGSDRAPMTPANLAPTISSIAAQIVDEDSITRPIAVTVDDAETQASALIVTARSSDTSLLPDAGIYLSGDGGERELVLQPAAGQSGMATVTVDVMDAGGQTASTSFDLEVMALYRGEFSMWMRTVALVPDEFDEPIGTLNEDGSALSEMEDIPRIKFSDDSSDDESAYDDLLPAEGDPPLVDDE